MSITEAAERTGLSGAYLRRLAQYGRIAACKRGLSKRGPWFIPDRVVTELARSYRKGVPNAAAVKRGGERK
jgi:excisionase family DNA binding protein